MVSHEQDETFAFHKPFLSLGFPKNTPESKHHNVNLLSAPQQFLTCTYMVREHRQYI